MNTLNKSFTALLLFFCFLTTKAQQTFEYKYDFSGNRTDRNVISLLKSSQSINTDSTNNQLPNAENNNNSKPFEERLGDMLIVIYPNPTQGQLKVMVEGVASDVPISIQLFNLGGVLQLNIASASNPQLLDLSAFVNGTYLLKLSVANQVSSWKIIKE